MQQIRLKLCLKFRNLVKIRNIAQPHTAKNISRSANQLVKGCSETSLFDSVYEDKPKSRLVSCPAILGNHVGKSSEVFKTSAEIALERLGQFV